MLRQLSTGQGHGGSNFSKEEVKLTKNLFIIWVVFFICWSPMTIMLFADPKVRSHITVYICPPCCHLYLSINLYVRTYVCMYVCTYVRMYVYMYICIHTCVRIYLSTYIHTCMHTYKHTYTCIHTYVLTYLIQTGR